MRGWIPSRMASSACEGALVLAMKYTGAEILVPIFNDDEADGAEEAEPVLVFADDGVVGHEFLGLLKKRS